MGSEKVNDGALFSDHIIGRSFKPEKLPEKECKKYNPLSIRRTCHESENNTVYRFNK